MTSMWIKSCSCCIEQTTIGVLLLGTKKDSFSRSVTCFGGSVKEWFHCCCFLKTIMKKIVGIWSWVWVDWSAMHDMRGSKVHLPKINFQLSTRTWFLLLSKSAFQRKALENNFIQNFTKRYVLLQTGSIAHPSLFLQILTSIWEDLPNTTLRCDLCKTRTSNMGVSPSKSAQNGQKMPRLANLKKNLS